MWPHSFSPTSSEHSGKRRESARAAPAVRSEEAAKQENLRIRLFRRISFTASSLTQSGTGVFVACGAHGRGTNLSVSLVTSSFSATKYLKWEEFVSNIA